METTASSTGKEMRACSQETDGALPGLGRGLEIIAATSNMLMLSFNMHKLSHVSFMVDKLATESSYVIGRQPDKSFIHWS